MLKPPISVHLAALKVPISGKVKNIWKYADVFKKIWMMENKKFKIKRMRKWTGKKL